MTRWIVGSSLKARGAVAAAAVVVVVLGVLQVSSAPKDVLPEFGQPTVQIQTEALGLSATEVEQLITVPLEQDLLNGTPFLESIRSRSVAGMSSIDMIFEPGTNLSDARQVVNERLTQAHGIPNVSKPPQMLQPLSSSSRLMMIGLSSKDVSLIDMSVLARWTVRPRLMGVPGVANVAIWGQRERELQVQVDPAKLQQEGVSLDQIITTTGNALWWSPLGMLEASTPGTGGFVDGPTQRLGVFHESPIKTPENLADVTIEDAQAGIAAGAAAGDEGPRTLGDVANVVADHPQLIGDAVLPDGPGLLLVIEKFPDANVVDVTKDVQAALDELSPGLAGITINDGIFRPASYVQKSTDNVMTALLIGVGLAALFFFVVLWDWRRAVISGITLLVSLIGAGLVLHLRGETANAMVLAGIVLAVVVLVDDSVIDVDHIRQRLRQHREATTARAVDRVIAEGSMETRSPLIYGTVVLLVALLPVLVLTGESGAFMPSVALSYATAIVVSAIVAMTLTPALSQVLLSKAPPRKSPIVGALERAHDSVIPRLIRSPRIALGALAVLLLGGVALLPTLNRPDSIVPTFRDTNLLIHWEGALATSITEMDRITARATTELRGLPGVQDVGGHVGRAVLADQIVSTNSGEMWVTIDPSADYDKTVALIKSTVAGYPGMHSSVLTYPRDRIDDVLKSSPNDLTVRLFGANNDVLMTKAADVQQLISGIKGVVNPKVANQRSEPTFEVEVNLEKAKTVGIKPGDVRRAAAALISGITVGALFEDQKVFDVTVWGTPETRRNLSTVRDLVINTPSGGHVRLGDVADVRITNGQNIVTHDGVSRSLDVTADVSGRSVGAVADEIKSKLTQLEMPFEYHAEVVGDYADRESSRNEFIAVTIAAAIGMFLLLQAAVGSWRLAGIAFLLLPASLAGGVVGVVIAGGDLTIGTIFGFAAVLGIVARHSILLISRYQQLERQGTNLPKLDLITRATRERFVPLVVTITGTAVALAPMLLFARSPGHEIAHAMSVVVVTGLISAAVVTLVVLPALYVRFSVGQVGLATPESIDLADLLVPSDSTGTNGGSEVATATTATD